MLLVPEEAVMRIKQHFGRVHTSLYRSTWALTNRQLMTWNPTRSTASARVPREEFEGPQAHRHCSEIRPPGKATKKGKTRRKRKQP